MSVAVSARSFYVAGVSMAAVVLAVFLFVQPIPQDPAYHSFADERTLAGIPNFWNVITNLPFVVIGMWGLYALRAGVPAGGIKELGGMYQVFFVGFLLVGFGSAYYHLDPDNASLVWDRAPMTLIFVAFFCAIVGEQTTPGLARRIYSPLIAAGLLSVLYWHVTEEAGAGDLRPYGIVQFLPMLLLPLAVILLPSPFSGRRWIWLAMLAYLLAKALEFGDKALFDAIGMSGHALKHLAAAASGIALIYALQRRRPRAASTA